jgi:HPt (histidine-containing phosphotransfer) domain-containing protein
VAQPGQALESDVGAPAEGSRDLQPTALLPGISQEAGLDFVMGRTDLYQNVLLKFMTLKGRTAEDLRAALNRGDLDEARRVAHSMISGAGTIGAQKLSATSLALEEALLTGELSTWQPLVVDFELDLREVLDGLTSHFGAR